MSTILKQISPETLKRIEDQSRKLGISPDEHLRRLLTASGQELALKPDSTDDEFEEDMSTFAEGTEASQIYDGTYSREDIYADHD